MLNDKSIMVTFKLLAKTNTEALKTIANLCPGCKVQSLMVYDDLTIGAGLRVYNVSLNVKQKTQKK